MTDKTPLTEWLLRGFGYVLTLLTGLILGYLLFNPAPTTSVSEVTKKNKNRPDQVVFAEPSTSIDQLLTLLEEGSVCEESRNILEKTCVERKNPFACSYLYFNINHGESNALDTPINRELHRKYVEALKSDCETGDIESCMFWKGNILPKDEFIDIDVYLFSDFGVSALGSGLSTTDKEYLATLPQNVDEVLKNHCHSGHVLDACLVMKFENEEEKNQLLSPFCDAGKYEACKVMNESKSEFKEKEDIAWQKRWKDRACEDGRWDYCGWEPKSEIDNSAWEKHEKEPIVIAAQRLCQTQGHARQVSACFEMEAYSKKDVHQAIQYQQLAKEAYLSNVQYKKDTHISSYKENFLKGSREYQDLCFLSQVVSACEGLLDSPDAKTKLTAMAILRKKCQELDQDACYIWATHNYTPDCRKQKL